MHSRCITVALARIAGARVCVPARSHLRHDTHPTEPAPSDRNRTC
ncbi:hypothetical protein FHX72_003696 [Pseudoclavibacter helvolus]|uniref:Uncharacterized protein n=1 Tax=Pseudoclavibacter helvolus TaxID=255205 RepID=A0A7W4URY0_9MICO|nr:hypothetical protein [Pseudoclavibacter helvolus]